MLHVYLPGGVIGDTTRFWTLPCPATLRNGRWSLPPSSSVRSPPGRIPSENITCFRSPERLLEPAHRNNNFTTIWLHSEFTHSNQHCKPDHRASKHWDILPLYQTFTKKFNITIKSKSCRNHSEMQYRKYDVTLSSTCKQQFANIL